MRCFQCGGPYHPATGHYYERWDIAFCGAHYQPFVKWVKGMMTRRWSGGEFYKEAETSIKPDAVPSARSVAALYAFMSLGG